MLVFGGLVDALFHRLCAYSLYIASTIVVDDGGDLGGTADIFMGREPTKRSS